jgi:hypothetical protein
MANGHGDFGWMYGRIGEKNWGKVSEWDVPWLMSILEIKKSDHVLVPTKEYDCPPHISKYIPKYKPGLNLVANTALIKVQMIQNTTSSANLNSPFSSARKETSTLIVGNGSSKLSWHLA